MNHWPFVAATAFLVSLVAVPLVRLWALQSGKIDIPNERSSHTVPKPRVGGIGIMLGSSAGILGIVCFLPGSFTSQHWILLAALFALGVVGFIDDLTPLAVWKRMPLYLLGAIAIALLATRISAIDLPLLPAWVMSPAIAVTFTALFIGWYTNLFNFMDGTDGIAGCAAAVTIGSLAIVFGTKHDVVLCLVAISLASATLAFLPYNFAPSSVFMGDVGSVFLGAAAGALTVAAVERECISLVGGVLLMFPFVFDATFTLFRRALRREKVWQAHRSHIYQQLCDLGMSHRNVAICYTGAAVLTASLGLAFDQLGALLQTLVLTGVVISALAVSAVVLKKNSRRRSELP